MTVRGTASEVTALVLFYNFKNPVRLVWELLNMFSPIKPFVLYLIDPIRTSITGSTPSPEALLVLASAQPQLHPSMSYCIWDTRCYFFSSTAWAFWGNDHACYSVFGRLSFLCFLRRTTLTKWDRCQSGLRGLTALQEHFALSASL